MTELYFQKHEGGHSLVDLTMDTKAQFFFIIVFTKGYKSISPEAQTITETCLSPSVFYDHFLFCFHRGV